MKTKIVSVDTDQKTLGALGRAATTMRESASAAIILSDDRVRTGLRAGIHRHPGTNTDEPGALRVRSSLKAGPARNPNDG